MSNVYLVEGTASESAEAKSDKMRKLWRAADLDRVLRPNDLTAVKLHVGEPGRPTYVSPGLVEPLLRCIEDAGASPFLTDTAVLYKSPRDNGVSHALVAHQHGFGVEQMGAPFLPVDGILGADELEVRVDGKHYETVAIASGILQARSVLLVTHVTGHLGIGFAGTLKNLGMGCCSRKAKLRQHHGQIPSIDASACTGCGTCAEWCPSEAIEVDDVATIRVEKCIGCGECIATCRDDAVTFQWGIGGRELQERIVEHAAAVVRKKAGRIAYIAVAQNMTKDCDCLGKVQEPLLDDIGVFASTDPLALEQAVYDTIVERAGRTLESMAYPRHDGSLQLAYAESMGLGSLEYELISLS